MRWKVLGATVFAASSLVLSELAYAQGMTSEEKYRALADAGIFDLSGDTEPVVPQSRGDLAAVIARLVGQTTTEPLQNDNVDDWAADYVNAASQLSLPSSGIFDPFPQLSREELALIVVRALGVARPETDGAMIEQNTSWAQGYVAATLGLSFIEFEPSPLTRERLIEGFNNSLPGSEDPGGEDPGEEEPGDGDEWADFPFYSGSQRTAVLPDWGADFLDSSGHATYNGVVRGTVADGEALAGTSSFDVFFNPGATSLTGNFAFDTGEIVDLSGSQDGDTLYVYLDGAFRGGTISGGEADAGFYGPNAEEFAGDWSFTVDGGTDPGVASGEFAAKR